METGREEVEQREQEKGLAEKGAANGRKRSRKEVEVGNEREGMRTGRKKGRRT